MVTPRTVQADWAPLLERFKKDREEMRKLVAASVRPPRQGKGKKAW